MITAYYSQKHVTDFMRAIPILKTEIGRERWQSHQEQFGIAGNTFRAFTGWTNKPSELYRVWAANQCELIDASFLQRQVQTKESFADWHAKLAKSLQKHWRKHEGEGLSVAHKYKVVDLFIKWLSRFDHGSPEITRGLVDFANCAIDSQILVKLNDCLSGALPIGAPSMGHVGHETTYCFCQDLIRGFSAHCGGTAVLFDHFAWKHGR